MARGNGKRLCMKLAGSATGLAVMLFVASSLAPDLPSEQERQAKKKTISYSYAYRVPQAPAAAESIFESVQHETRRATARAGWDAKVALRDAYRVRDLVKNEARLDRAEILIDIQSSKIAAFSDAIREIEANRAIPHPVKAEIVADLERQIVKAERKLQELEDKASRFSRLTELRPLREEKSRCDNEITIQTCDGDCRENEASEKRSRTDSGEAFYWI